MPFCPPSQLLWPLMLKWMLVFEEPNDGSLWLCKACPRSWFDAGETISVEGAPVPSMNVRISFNLSTTKSDGHGTISADVAFQSDGKPAAPLPPVSLVLRAPTGWTLSSVAVAGRQWKNYSGETVHLPANQSRAAVVASYAAHG